MPQPSIPRILAAVRSEGWWIVPQLMVVVALSLTVGLWGLWSAYAVFNSILVWLYASQKREGNVRQQKIFKLLAIPLLPTGFATALMTGGGASPSDLAGGASPDEGIRKATAQSSHRIPPPSM